MGIWKQTSKDLVTKSQLFKFFSVGFKSEKSGKEGKFDVLESKNWANVVPVTSDKKAIMVKQFRYGIGEVTLEFPSGIIEDGQTPLEAAQRELAEETGGTSETLEETGNCHANPAFLNNRCYHFAATGVKITQKQKFDEFEEIETELVPLDQIDAMIANGKISHSLSITAWYFFKMKNKDSL